MIMEEILQQSAFTQNVVDAFGRPLKSLRLSVTDRCNLRCSYCMPEEEYVWLPREDVLTNGILLPDQAEALYQAGLNRVTVSLDTLRPERFRQLTRRDEFARVLEGIESAGRAGFTGLKLDTVAIRGFNDDELVGLIEFAKHFQAEVRFIEYMDVGGANRWAAEKVLSREMMLAILGKYYGTIEALPERGSAPAQRFRLPDGATFGIIPSTTTPFCSACDRSRLTADGMWYRCLYATTGTDLRKPLREGVAAHEMLALIRAGWEARRDRGAEERKALERAGLREGGLIGIDRLREDPHLEMHARGG
jgi:cyclic pyranopterin phosphate synthase